MSKQLTTINNTLSIDEINDMLSNVTKKHEEVSRIKTPKVFIKKKQNFDYVDGVMRNGDMVAAHSLQKLKGTQQFSGIGNDVKAANTDTMKKAFNMFMNIADDVYKNQVEDPELSDEQKNELLLLAKILSDAKYEEILENIEDTLINTMNFNGAKKKLQRLVKEYEEHKLENLVQHNEKKESK